MFCPACGTKIPDDAKVCPQCGISIKAGESAPAADAAQSSESSAKQPAGPVKPASSTASAVKQKVASATKTVAAETATQNAFNDDPDAFRTLPVVFDGERIEIDRVVLSTANVACSYINVPRISFPRIPVIIGIVVVLADLVSYHTAIIALVGIALIAFFVITYLIQVSTSVKSVVLRMSSGDSVLIQSNKIVAAAHEVMPLVSAAIKTHDVYQSITVPNARVRVEESGRHPLGL